MNGLKNLSGFWMFGAFFTMLAVVLSSFLAFESYPTDYFRSPIDRKILLSGTFGELRSNHFHSGIDIRGETGWPLYAAADGYIARIKVQAGGYGRALYIAHPNGYTTVYAHMSSFSRAVEDFVLDQQYRRKSFSQDIYLKPGQFTVRKGEDIGKMGSSGYSYAPHLHFEIRRTDGQKPLNPLLFGLQVEDDLPPSVNQLMLYQLDDHWREVSKEAFTILRGHPHHTLAGRDTLYATSAQVGVGIWCFDRLNGRPNKNGIYGLELKIDDTIRYAFQMEEFSFSQTRYLNAHIDYGEDLKNGRRFIRCFQLPGNRLPIYDISRDRGLITLEEGAFKRVELAVFDKAGNSSVLRFWLGRKEGDSQSRSSEYNFFLPHREENLIENYDARIFFPRGTFYRDQFIHYESHEDHSTGIYSKVHSLHDIYEPVHRRFEISLRPEFMPDHLREKAFIAYCSGPAIVNCGGVWRGNKLYTRVRELGKYSIMVDTLPPRIEEVDFRRDMRQRRFMRFKITDDLPTSGTARGLRYRATIDGQWILMEYDLKNDMLIHEFDGRTGPGRHQLELWVADDRNNESVFTGEFIR